MGGNSKKSSPASAGRLAVARRFNGGVTEKKSPTALPKARAQQTERASTLAINKTPTSGRVANNSLMPEPSILKNILDRRGNQYGCFTLEVCMMKTNSGYEIVFAKMTAQKQGTVITSPPPLDFGDYAYAARSFNANELLEIIQEQNPTFKIGSYEFVLTNATLRLSGLARMSSNNIMSDWPAELLELRSSSHANYLNPKALVAHGASRVFHDQYDGIQQYMGAKVSFNYNNGWIGAMLFILPDYRIRIQEVVGEGKLVIVKTEKDNSLLGARLHCLVEGAEGREEILQLLNEPNITLQFQSAVDQIEIIRIFVTTAEGIIDSYEQTSAYHSGRTRWLAGVRKDNRKDVVTEISKGEGPNLEFKPFVRIGKGEKKEIEVVRAAIAFANAGGGSILFGINNVGEIEGIEKDLLASTTSLEPRAAGDNYGRQLRTLVNDATNLQLELHSSVVDIANHILVRVDVSELPVASKPVWHLATKDTWIRRGSTNLKLDPDTIRSSFGGDVTFGQNDELMI
jgi:hypothetical protein